jgi:hypothetical protein
MMERLMSSCFKHTCSFMCEFHVKASYASRFI